ncbi:dTDP-4-amino-4,6-dideoxygalactose transaminase [Fodinibius roseus]|uniref:dTDP-4-amino-4,6-dideoxygalactose transaminase n=1 Tax=Fodinibius roseus TaxID=1194090 RepID=A0A1M5GLK3_9BACT|nr:DegT/DnrJ/EryC1/StrS family aminotransferase [Fodinibius roseus]SHG04635.1 dTDP-4-amino-4,6-dideoxygalactose transaminase [Fodinibius roseus]
MIPITKPFMPPRAEYEEYLEGIWQREYLTNNGPLVQELEAKLRAYLDIEHLLFVSNGTIALQIAINALGLKGEIITTPYSYVATASSIVWEGCTPVFVDIDEHTLNIDPNLIEDAITDTTSGIIATHVYGNPCDMEAIQEIADKYDLKVIYDASHCFGTEFEGKSVFDYGDVSTVSFHATKLYHTIEGGAVISRHEDVNHKISRMRNFGHAGPGNFEGVGINGKNSEFHAAMGLCILNYIDEILVSRKNQWLRYADFLTYANARGITIHPAANFNYAYFPVVFESETVMLKVKASLEKNEIYPRRYFYPSLSELDYMEGPLLNRTYDISKRVLCLPLYYDLIKEEQKKVISVIQENIKEVVYE